MSSQEINFRKGERIEDESYRKNWKFQMASTINLRFSVQKINLQF